MGTRSRRSAKARQDSASHRSRKSVEDINNPREDQDPTPSRRTPQPKDTENLPNEISTKDPDGAYGDTQIPHRSHRTR